MDLYDKWKKNITVIKQINHILILFYSNNAHFSDMLMIKC
jgi:hypothetical protein